ncbi:hypothetical protein C3L23_03850 [Nautilia sp. PV-1]|uniref:hypothetical protein n=1 Tax=Nautilia sp. PV-1 TaxID=2579250 RepID=UPI000FDCA28B|nr:hypothetical protein [Nautilia sp. PV-1]AZV46430.1 hypothetical protein C3L23_03850 [Nautilia sp. PV-1]
MKKIILLFFIFSGMLFSQDIEVKLFSKLFTTLFNKKTVFVYTENKKYQNLQSIFLVNVKDCKKADIVLGISKKCKTKPHFLLDYYNYKKDKNAIGAFYWRKGRPQLRLRKKMILKYHLYISPEFEDYLE